MTGLGGLKSGGMGTFAGMQRERSQAFVSFTVHDVRMWEVNHWSDGTGVLMGMRGECAGAGARVR